MLFQQLYKADMRYPDDGTPQNPFSQAPIQSVDRNSAPEDDRSVLNSDPEMQISSKISVLYNHKTGILAVFTVTSKNCSHFPAMRKIYEIVRFP